MAVFTDLTYFRCENAQAANYIFSSKLFYCLIKLCNAAVYMRKVMLNHKWSLDMYVQQVLGCHVNCKSAFKFIFLFDTVVFVGAWMIHDNVINLSNLSLANSHFTAAEHIGHNLLADTPFINKHVSCAML